MIKSLSATASVLAFGALVAAAPASAASVPVPTGVGYLAAPAVFHSARVTVRVPTIHCGKTSPKRALKVGLFVTVVQHNGSTYPVSLTVQASCRHARSTYKASSSVGEPLRVHAADRVELVLSGRAATSYRILDRTTGKGVGSAISIPNPKPKTDRHVLIGARIIGARPHGVTASFDNAKLDGTPLPQVTHHRRGSTRRTHVSTLTHGDFSVSFGVKHPH